MHTVVIRRAVYERNRWIACTLLNAFEEAKKLAMKAYDADDFFFNAPSMIPWFVSLREKNRALMGDDFWPYGITENRKAIETCLRYHREQGILKRTYRMEDLFAPETLN
jgi:4,5-dihydroxyphthalate decarboxylase